MTWEVEMWEFILMDFFLLPFTGALLTIFRCLRFLSKSTEVVLMRDTPRWYCVVHIIDAFLTTFSSLAQNLDTKQRNQLRITHGAWFVKEYCFLLRISCSDVAPSCYFTDFIQPDQGALRSILQRQTSIAHGTLQDIRCYGRWCLGFNERMPRLFASLEDGRRMWLL